VEKMAADLGVSERQLRRRSRAAVGYGPATLRRVLRFRRFVSSVDQAGEAADLAWLAAKTGYADQAHLTRESTRLAGLPPAALARVRHHDNALAGQVAERVEDVSRVTLLYDILKAEALAPRASIDLVRKAVETWT
jgi:transcriptional regulator GlxA family with amidase domain